jgi:uncharacterized protein YkwD
MLRRRLVIAFSLTLALVSTDAVVSEAPAVAAAASGQQIANRVLAQLNKERKAHRLRPLKMHRKLVASAHKHNLTMARIRTLTHQAPGEAFFGTRIRRAGFAYSYAGENIGENSQSGVRGGLTLESLMYNEKPPNDGHRRNILDKHFTYVGIDVVIDKSGRLWLTEDFARPL